MEGWVEGAEDGTVERAWQPLEAVDVEGAEMNQNMLGGGSTGRHLATYTEKCSSPDDLPSDETKSGCPFFLSEMNAFQAEG
jgi:hypothetical protein